MAKLDWYIRANLQPRHMQMLIALDELRLVARVASYLNVSQPAVSKTLSELERGLGVELFVRTPRGMEPTAYGNSLIKLSRSVMREFDATRDEIRRLESGADGQIRVGVLPVAAPLLVPRALIHLRQDLPNTSIALHEGTSDHLLPRLRQGDLDIVVGSLPPASMATGLQEVILHPGERINVVCSATHPLARQDDVTVDDLKAYMFVLPPLGSAFRVSVDSAMVSLGIESSHALIESGSMTATNTFIRETAALSFYSQHLANHYSRMGAIKVLPIDIPNLTAPVGMVWLIHPSANPALELFQHCLVEQADALFDTRHEVR